MRGYFLRRLLYMLPVLPGVVLLTFLLFYVVQSPHAMARRMLGPKAPEEAIQNWLHQRGYDRPVFLNTKPLEPWWDTQFTRHFFSLMTFDFGHSDATGESVSKIIRQGVGPSLCITLPAFILGLSTSVSVALFLVLIRESVFDRVGALFCVASMSIPMMIYVIFGQWLLAVKMSIFPVFGFEMSGFSTMKFLVMPVLLCAFAGLGSEVRMYRAVFLEEIRQDYVRTALAKGASDIRVLFKHVFKNGLIALITMVVASLPFLMMGSLVIESFFGVPGLGDLMMKAIRTSDFAVIRAEVYLGTLLFLVGLLATDFCYALADPRIRLK